MEIHTEFWWEPFLGRLIIVKRRLNKLSGYKLDRTVRIGLMMGFSVSGIEAPAFLVRHCVLAC